MKSKLTFMLIVAALSVGCIGSKKNVQEPTRTDNADDDKKDAYVDARSGWDKLGERRVDGTVDYDVIEVGAKEGKYRKVMLIIEQSSLELYSVKFTFGDGTDYSPSVSYTFGPNESTRVIDLPGGDRVIRKVEFKYSNLPGGGKAQVELWAKQ
jgi:hypothetical protein